eukprot:5140710-Amphidinium_carterae.1
MHDSTHDGITSQPFCYKHCRITFGDVRTMEANEEPQMKNQDASMTSARSTLSTLHIYHKIHQMMTYVYDSYKT